jgi:hypothetical protein
MRDIPHKRKVPEGLSMGQGGTMRERPAWDETMSLYLVDTF